MALCTDGARIGAQRGAIKAENRGGDVYARGPRTMDLCFWPVKKRRYAVGRAREGREGAYPHPSPPAKTNEGAMRSGETGAWTARRPRERLDTPSKDLPFTVWATPQLRDLVRVGTVWYGPFTDSVLIHSRTGPRLGPPCAPAPPRTPPPPHGRARPSCARKCLGSWRAWRGP